MFKKKLLNDTPDATIDAKIIDVIINSPDTPNVPHDLRLS